MILVASYWEVLVFFSFLRKKIGLVFISSILMLFLEGYAFFP